MSTDDEMRRLALNLLSADTEEEVVNLLEAVGLWQDSGAWRYYGDMENNYSAIGNQMSRPDSALVEKLINSIDHRLINACLESGINPESPSAPQSIQDAVARFISENPHSPLAGKISEWPAVKRSEVARGITLAATGYGAREGSGKPCFTIADSGEGQTPEMMPRTLLSLMKSNKLRIPFVQGKFNMGSTGVLPFCGTRGLQLILSRRNPNLVQKNSGHASDGQWGFTVVRRQDPKGFEKHSTTTYLAPVGASSNPEKGGVLRFSAEEIPVFPEGNSAYVRRSKWGTVVKLYEYAATGYSNGHILMPDGLLSRLDILLPDLALPIRLHECRKAYRGHSGSFDTTLTGLGVRLDDNRGDNLEMGFPNSCPLSSDGEQMTATIYAFKKERAGTYRKNEGIIFTLNLTSP